MTSPSEIAATDFIGADGLIHCGICGEPKQARIQKPKALFGQEIATTYPIQCACEREASERAIAEHMEKERKEAIERARFDCFPYEVMQRMTFAADDGKDAGTSEMLKKYADNFERFLDAGAGLLLYGAVGSGKTFYASCIANRVIDQGFRVLFTSLSVLGSKMQADFGKDKLPLLDRLCMYDLVVLDDLGVERTTPTMAENSYQIINALYQSGSAMILTTNNDVSVMQKEQEPEKVRIYSRILECCKPVHISGGDRRKAKAKEKAALFREVLG